MYAKETLASDERAVEAGQHSEPAQHASGAKTVGYYEPHQMGKLAQNGRLYVIADSVGPASGQIAAEYAVKKVLHSFYNSENPDLESRLLEVIQAANHDIFERNREQPQRRVMAATVMAALIHDNKLLVAGVGDSRVYVVWDEDVEQLNSPLKKKDGNKNGPQAPALIPEKASTPTDKPALPTSLTERIPPALGLEEKVKIETFSRRLFAGDVVVMCSGSLSGYLTEQEIARAMTKHTPDQAIRRLVALAAERGNRSHIALSVSRVLSSPVAMRSPLPMIMPTPPSWSDWEKPPKPGQPGEDKPATRPLSKPIPPVPPMTTPITRPPSTEIPLTPSRWGRRVLIMLGAAILLLCVLPLLIWGYVLPPGTLASVPVLGQMEEAMLNRAGELGVQIDLGATPPAETEEVFAETGDEVAQPVAAQSNSPLPTPTLAIEATAVPTAATTPTTLTPSEAATDTIVVPSPTPSPTPAPTIVLPANCENKARFVDDVTVEDGTQFGPNQDFDKVWRIRNEGTCPWGPGFTIRFQSGDSFGRSNQAPLLAVTEPDSTVDLAVPMIAPAEAGNYRGVWQLFDLAGEPFGPTMYLEIEVVPGLVASAEAGGSGSGQTETLYDFVASAPEATWTSGQVTYPLESARVDESLDLPDSGGMVAVGSAFLRGNVESEGEVLLTYPHQELGFIQGDYVVDTPLQPGDAIAVTLGFPKLSILSDDGVTFEISFTPDVGTPQVITVFSQLVDYRDSPISQVFPLPADIEAGQTGTFTLRVLSGESTSQDWAVWIDARLVRP